MLLSLPEISLVDLLIATCVAACLWLVWPREARGGSGDDAQD